MEDKKCRICGLADMNNFNIFQSKTLPAKIVAVYPIALYKNDPLPKHICKKCCYSTQTMYNEVERALRNQSKWIANIRLVQPENQYLKVVDSIAGANKQTSQLVSLIAGSEIGERTISKLFNFDLSTQPSPKKRQTQGDIKSAPEPVKTEKLQEVSAESIEADLLAQPQEQTSPKKLPVEKPPVEKPPVEKITQLQSVLELNGCTLTKVKPATKKSRSPETTKTKTKNDPLTKPGIEIKEEPLDEVYEPPVQTEQSEPVPEHHVKCKMCPFSCETIEELAIHQLDHLNISASKLSERRILSKRTRRGRLIMVEEKKCIRCLNCWRIFADNKSILKHWSEGDCDFFCQICGKEFASSPKMLREHIPAAHGISYRSSKILRPPTLVPSKTIKTEKSPVKTAAASLSPIKIEPGLQKVKIPRLKPTKKPSPNGSLTVKVACNICLKVFANFKARNSHMRAHKHPPFLPAQPPPPLNEALMALNRTDMLPIKDEPLDTDNIIPFQEVIPQNPPPRPLPVVAPAMNKPGPAFSKINNPTTKHPRLKVIPTRTSAGVRKKHTPYIIRPDVIKTEPELMCPSPEIANVKSIVDLQDPCVSSQLPEESDKLFFDVTPTHTPSPKLTSTSTSNGAAASINGLSFDFGVPPKDNMNYGQVFTCHPCGLKFNSKLELFRHKRKCSANNLFPCQFCEKHFVTSADLQMHIVLLHKSSSVSQ